MKFSVVIPTHDRLGLLRDAIETVTRQDYQDWELVVFDNASVEDIAGHVASLRDDRIRYARSTQYLPVTDSWNQAVDLATGEYVIFLGDDDGLAPSYFTRVVQIIESFASPEVLYSGLYQFFHPGVAPWEPGGYVAEIRNGFFFAGRESPFLLSREQAQQAVNGSLALRRNFTFNIQAFAFARQFLARLRADGPLFRSPFPDYYFANIAFAKARTIVVVPSALAIAGVSKASFGFTLFNNLEDRGAEILNAKLASDPFYGEVEKFLLPGPQYNTNYVVTMEHVARYTQSFAGRGVDYGRYRRLQAFTILKSGNGRLPRSDRGRLLWSRLSIPEKAWTIAVSLSLRLGRLLGLEDQVRVRLERAVHPYGFDPEQTILNRGGFSRLAEVFSAIQDNRLTRVATPLAKAASNAPPSGAP